VLLDIKLAQGSGFDVLRALRRDCAADRGVRIQQFPLARVPQLASKPRRAGFFDKTTEIGACRRDDGRNGCRASTQSIP
jgi:hypothetical protein